jgi:hypothetical protein
MSSAGVLDELVRSAKINPIVGERLSSAHRGAGKKLSDRHMQEESRYKPSPEESSEIMSAPAVDAERFIFESLGRQLVDMLRKGRRRVPESFQSRGVELIEGFQKEFFALLSEKAKRVRFNSVQVEYLSKVLTRSIDLRYDTYQDEIMITKNIEMLLKAATYVNSLDV